MAWYSFGWPGQGHPPHAGHKRRCAVGGRRMTGHLPASVPVLPLLGELDMHLIAEGRHWELADCLGAHVMEVAGRQGTRFAVWAPNARRVAVVGDFNGWDGDCHPMRLRRECGVWEVFISGVAAGALYKYEIHAEDGTLLPWKADPLARQTELPPATASIVTSPEAFVWTDDVWMEGRASRQAPNAAISIYEVHLGSWMTDSQDDNVWNSVGPRLIEYASGMGFTHLE